MKIYPCWTKMILKELIFRVTIYFTIQKIQKKKYWLTLKSLEFVKKKTEDINSTLVLFSHPYAWYVDPKQSKYYQVRNYGKIYDFRKNKVYADLVKYYSEILKVDYFDSHDFFINNPGSYWGDLDPHFNALGYEKYAEFIFSKIKTFKKLNRQQRIRQLKAGRNHDQGNSQKNNSNANQTKNQSF